jgi:hypothetical protein
MFASKDMTAGELNALVKLVGGENAARDLIRGKQTLTYGAHPVTGLWKTLTYKDKTFELVVVTPRMLGFHDRVSNKDVWQVAENVGLDRTTEEVVSAQMSANVKKNALLRVMTQVPGGWAEKPRTDTMATQLRDESEEQFHLTSDKAGAIGQSGWILSAGRRNHPESQVDPDQKLIFIRKKE